MIKNDKKNSVQNCPNILVFAGHDPSGGAGIQADIEAIAAQGAHALPIITALTQQDTQRVYAIYPQAAEQVLAQANCLYADMPISAIKIGLTASVDIIHVIAAFLKKLLKNSPNTPVILDPVLAAGGGGTLSNQAVQQHLACLYPYTSVITPNSLEARQLTGQKNLAHAAQQLGQQGCQSVLITGTHEQNQHVENSWYTTAEPPYTLTWQRLADEYHGSGCTLAAALAAQLAMGNDIKTALQQAQAYTWQSLQQARKLGQGQLIPQRITGVNKV